MRSRARSLLLLTVVASTGLLATLEACGSSSSSTPTPNEAGTTSGSSGASSGTSGTSSGTSGASSGTSGTSGTSGSSGDAGFDAADARDAAPPCLNDTLVGAAPVCPGGDAGACKDQCAALNINFKKGVAAEVLKNLNVGICGADTANLTTMAALAKSCADPTAAAFCGALADGGCSDPAFPAACLATANGLSGIDAGANATLGRHALWNCINNDPRTCLQCIDFVRGKLIPPP